MHRNILRSIILCSLLVMLPCMAHAGDNRQFSCGPSVNLPNPCAAPQCAPIQKVPTTPGVRHPSGVYPGGSDKLIPLTYVEPGPIRAIAFYAVGLIKSTVAAPFRLIEAVIPVGKNDCRPPRPVCGPQPVFQPQPCVPLYKPVMAACAPPAVRQPQPCVPVCRPVMAGCAPAAPHLGPLPRPACQPSCGPNLPPQVVKEYEFPPVELDNLLSGLWNFPRTLFRQGRLTGDVFRNDPYAPVRCAR